MLSSNQYLRWFVCEEHGQGLVEYALIVLAIGVAVASAVNTVGGEVREFFLRAADGLGH